MKLLMIWARQPNVVVFPCFVSREVKYEVYSKRQTVKCTFFNVSHSFEIYLFNRQERGLNKFLRDLAKRKFHVAVCRKRHTCTLNRVDFSKFVISQGTTLILNKFCSVMQSVVCMGIVRFDPTRSTCQRHDMRLQPSCAVLNDVRRKRPTLVVARRLRWKRTRLGIRDHGVKIVEVYTE